MEGDFQCTLLGDVLFTVETTISIRLTVSGPTNYDWSEVLDAGSWFSSPLALLLYMVDSWNDSIPGGQMSVRLEADPSATHYRKFEFVPETGLGTVTALRIRIPGQYADFGLSSADHDLGSGTSTKRTAVAPYVLTPQWPPAEYSRGTRVQTGGTARGHDGTAYGLSGITQGTTSVSWALNRYDGTWGETVLYRNLWRDRWTLGRAVTMYLDRGALPETWSSTLADADVLELPSNGEVPEFSRMIEHAESINFTRTVEFVNRKSRPTDTHEHYSEGAVAPAAASRVTHFYRAVLNEALSATGYTMPDEENCCAAIWFRVLFTNRAAGIPQIVTESGWAEPVTADEPNPNPTKTLIISDNGDEADHIVSPHIGEWTLLTLQSDGSEMYLDINGISDGNYEPFSVGDSMDANPTIGNSTANAIVIDVANIGYWNVSDTMTQARALSLYQAGVRHDYANPFENWPGSNPLVYWCGTPTTVVPNTNVGLGGAHDLEWSGTPSYGIL